MEFLVGLHIQQNHGLQMSAECWESPLLRLFGASVAVGYENTSNRMWSNAEEFPHHSFFLIHFMMKSPMFGEYPRKIPMSFHFASFASALRPGNSKTTHWARRQSSDPHLRSER